MRSKNWNISSNKKAIFLFSTFKSFHQVQLEWKAFYLFKVNAIMLWCDLHTRWHSELETLLTSSYSITHQNCFQFTRPYYRNGIKTFFEFPDCFKKTVSYGRWTAVMTTFLASTFLHGFNFQLGAVLLSLGFFTFIEDKMRSKLASLFSASIEARRPRNVGRFEPATFRYREGSLVVMLANGGLGILTVIHLMYLGVMFDQSEVQTEGYRWNHTIDKWESLGFFSHYFMLAAFLLSFFLWEKIFVSLKRKRKWRQVAKKLSLNFFPKGLNKNAFLDMDAILNSNSYHSFVISYLVSTIQLVGADWFRLLKS